MSTPRRQIIRPATGASSAVASRQRQAQKLRSQLEREQNALARWQTRMRRSFKAVEKHHVQIARIQRRLARMGEQI
jgi:hypothetical protein